MNNSNPIVLTASRMQYAPQNELGVVFLFCEWAVKRRLKIERIQAAFPDCLAMLSGSRGRRLIRIEFEFRSSRFRQHRHRASECDWIVCWEHDWPDVPKHLKVIELRKYYGLGFNVWVQPVSETAGVKNFSRIISETHSSADWTVARSAHKGDLVLFYHTGVRGGIGDVFRLTQDPEYRKSRWSKVHVAKNRKDFFALLRRVTKLRSRVSLNHMRRDPIVGGAPFVRAQMQGRQNATEYWPFLRDLIVRLNASQKRTLTLTGTASRRR